MYTTCTKLKFPFAKKKKVLFPGSSVRINGECLPEMKIRKSDYKIEFLVDPVSRSVLEARCPCVAGMNAKCKHGAALFTYVNCEMSEGKTDDAQSWQGPSKRAQNLYPKGEKNPEDF